MNSQKDLPVDRYLPCRHATFDNTSTLSVKSHVPTESTLATYNVELLQSKSQRYLTFTSKTHKSSSIDSSTHTFANNYKKM